MPQYEVSVLSDYRHPDQPTLLAIASILGVNIVSLKVDRTKQSMGTVRLIIATVRPEVVNGIQRLVGVQYVKSLPNGT